MEKFEVEATDFPVCPGCGKADRDYWDGLPKKRLEDGDRWPHECPYCETEYEITISVRERFSTHLTAAAEELIP